MLRTPIQNRPAMFVALLAGTILSSSAAVAQTAAPDTGDIIVTAQKRSESLQKVPISIQALSAKKLEEHQVTSFDDYAKLLPSVSFQSFGPGQSQVYFRGITSGGDGQHNGSQPTSAVYVDEIPLTTVANTVDLHIYDMQRVEALSGPQGTLFGSSSLAGTLRLITNKPSHKFEAGVDVSGTSFGKGAGSSGGSFDGFVNLPINPAMAFRASVFYEKDGGYISNTPFTRVYQALDVNGNPTTVSTNNTATPSTKAQYNFAHNFAKKNFNTTETYGGRAALGIDLNESWTATPSVIYQHQQANGSFLFDPKVGDLQVHDFTPDINVDQWTQAALTIHGKLGNWDVTYAGGYFDRHVDSTADYSYYTVSYYNSFGPAYTSFIDKNGKNIDPTQIVHGHDNYTKQSHELRVSSPSGDRFRLTAGMFYQRQTDGIVADYLIPGLAAAQNSVAVPQCGDNIFCTRAYRIDRDYAMFADASFDILPNLTLNGGIRGFMAHNEVRGFSGLISKYMAAPCTKGATAGICNNFNTGTVQSGETHKLNLTWKVDRDHMIYATYSTGYRPGGINRSQGIPPYNADTLSNYEIGVKTAWLHRMLTLNVAIFDEEWKDLQYGLSVPGSNGVVSTYNAGNARVKGVEGDVNLQLGHLTLSGSGSYIDAKLTKGFCSYDANNNPIDCAPVGTRLPIQPKFKGNLTARYRFDFGSAKAFLQGGINHQSGTRSYLTNNEAALLGNTAGFSTFDFSLGANMGHWTWEAYVQNAFDNRGIISLNTVCVPSICGAYARSYPTKPQEFGIKFGKKF